MASGPPLQVANAVQVRLAFTIQGGGVAMNIMAAQKTPALVIDQALANTVGSAIKTAWTSNMATNSPASMTLVAVGLRDLTNVNLAEFVDSGAGVTGTGTGDDLPRSVAYCVTLRTAKAGSAFRGRVYLGPFTEGGNGPGGNAAAAIQTGCLAFINAVKTALSSSSLTLAVLSKPAFATTTVKTTTNSSGGSDTETKRTDSRAGAITPVTAVVGRNLTWDSQRRRTSAGTASTLLLSPERMQIDF